MHYLKKKKIPKNYCPCLYLSIEHPVSCTNTHHDITDLAKHGMVKNTKVEYLENKTTFL